MARIYLSILFCSFLLSGCGSGKEDLQNDRWKGNWARAESGDGAELEINKINGDTLSFILFATNGASYSQQEGTALITDNTATFLADADGIPAECEVVFALKDDSTVSILEGGSECGNAMYVWYMGEYRKGKKN
jgi:hypothetical protein